jgi:Ca2+-binding EF-hand superfamily protein
MNKDEFIRLYKKLYPNSMPDNYVTFAYKAFRRMNRERIGFDKFLLVLLFTLSLDKGYDMTKALELAFDIYDQDETGTIDLAEMEEILVAVYEIEGLELDRAKQHVHEIFAEFDLDRNMSLDKYEFIKFVNSNPIASKVFL